MNRMMKWFEAAHLPSGIVRDTSNDVAALARLMDRNLLRVTDYA